MLIIVSAYSSDRDLNVTDATGNGVEVDVATNLMNGTVRLSVLWTDEIYLCPDDAERVAQALLRAAERGRRIAGPRSTGPDNPYASQ
jgi:transcriptional regulator GlxA family with amidase domain